MFSGEFSEISKNTFFYRTSSVAASGFQNFSILICGKTPVKKIVLRAKLKLY